MILAHVADRIDMDAGGHDRHHHDHRGGQGVQSQRPRDIQRPGRNPRHQINRAGVPADRDIEEQNDPQHCRQDQPPAGDDLRPAVAERPAEKASNQRAQKRQENNSGRHD